MGYHEIRSNPTRWPLWKRHDGLNHPGFDAIRHREIFLWSNMRACGENMMPFKVDVKHKQQHKHDWSTAPKVARYDS